MQRDVHKFGFYGKRGRILTSADPYQSAAGLREPALCQSCQAVYRQKRWQLDPVLADQLGRDAEAHWVTCPACLKVAEHYPEGILTLRGSYLWNHEAEIRNIIGNTVARFAARNPLDRIIRTQRTDEALIIETTDNKLVEHLGRLLHKAHSGKLRIDWQGAPVVCRVQWERGH
jgi:NMD protein affecting ribosome stability and mRNA decay